MPSHHKQRHCFVKANYYATASLLVVHFTEGEFYAYPDFSLLDWLRLKTNASHGKLYNADLRRPNRVLLGYNRAASFPPGESDTFEN